MGGLQERICVAAGGVLARVCSCWYRPVSSSFIRFRVAVGIVSVVLGFFLVSLF